MKIKHLILIFVLIMALGLAACTRSASQSPTQVPDGGDTTPDQQPPSNMETAVAGGGFATQTAQALQGTPGQGEQAGQTPEATAETPGSGEIATPVPGATEVPGGEPTAAPPAGNTPVATAQPTTAVGGGCTSPYTVQSGEWVWSIGRKCNISPQAIIDANNLACYYDFYGTLQCPVYAGDKLVLPANAPPFIGP
jgi:LysM repeat protein